MTDKDEKKKTERVKLLSRREGLKEWEKQEINRERESVCVCTCVWWGKYGKKMIRTNT